MYLYSTNLDVGQSFGKNTTQNLTALNILEPNPGETKIVNNELIVLIKQSSQMSPEEGGFTLEDLLSSIVRVVENQGFKVNTSQLLSNLGTIVLTLDFPYPITETSTFNITDAHISSNTTENQPLVNLLSKIEKNPFVENVEINKLMVVH